MAQSREQIEAALEWAKQNNDEAAVRGLTSMLEASQGSTPPENYVPGAASQEIAAQSDPMPQGGWQTDSPAGALPPPSTDAQIDQQLEQRQAGPALAQQSSKPWGEPTQNLVDKLGEASADIDAQKWEKAKKQFAADQELLQDPANVPSKEETTEWLKMQQKAMRPTVGMGAININPAAYAPIVNAENKQVIRDPETNRLRWAALPPEAIYGDDKTSVGKIVAGALGSTVIDMVGKRVEDIENENVAVETMQRYVFSSLSDDEKSRVRNDLAREYDVDPSKITDDIIAEKVPPHMLKRVVDANKNNQFIYEQILSEEDDGFMERAGRAGKKLKYGLQMAGTYAANAMSPDWGDAAIDAKREELRQQPDTGPVLGRDTLAAKYLDLWNKEASSEGSSLGDVASRIIAEPLKAFDPELEFGQTIRAGAEKVRETAYGEYYDRTKNPMLKPGTKFEDMLTMEPYTTEGTSSPLVDPIAFAIKGVEQLPYMLPGVLGGWGGGKVSQKIFTNVAGRTIGKESLEVTIKELERLSRRRSMAGGVFGNAVGNSVVYDQAGAEVRDTINDVPDQRLMENPEVKSLMALGMTFEEAKQLLSHEAAGKGGRNAWAASSLITAPTAMLSGMGGGGTLLAKNQGARALAAAIVSPVEEGVQELVEGYAADVQIERIDPENPVLKDAGRFTERFFGGMAFAFATQSPLEAISALESQAPAGVDAVTQKAAQLTQDFLDARNERFALELKVTDPKYVESTSGIRRLEQLEKLQELQIREADAILAMASPVREWMKANEAQGRDADIAMLDSLERFANSQKTDISVARNERMTARQMLEEHEAMFEERAELQKNVNDKLVDIEDIKRMQRNLTTAQEQEPMTNQDLSELIEEEYVVTVGESDRPIITPKGRRALKNLGRQRLAIEQSLNEGFAGKERRSPESLARRDQIDNMSEEDKETVLYRDAVTDLPNKRAYRERGQDAAAHATVKVDSLEWVNENMNFAAGDRMLNHVATAIEEAIETIGATDAQLYRTAGNEFSVTGASQTQVEEIMQVAAARIAKERVTDGRTDVTPTVTWGKGDTQAASEKAAAKARVKRVNEGAIADVRQPAKTATRKKPGLFMKDATDAEFAKVVLKHDVKALAKLTVLADWMQERDIPNDGTASNEQLDQVGKKARGLRLDKELSEQNYSTYDLAYDELSDLDIPNEYDLVTDQIEKGDIVEILTPDSAQFGTVTRVQDIGGSRPRITIAIGDRRYRFNPEKNWLINHPMSSPADIAYITGDSSMMYADNIPQVLEEVQIGLMGKGGDSWYADLATPEVTDKQNVNEFMSTQFSPNKQSLPKASKSEIDRSEAVRDSLFVGYENIPEINLVHDLNEFRAENGDLYNQILAEVRASGGSSLRGVKGYFDHFHPKAGVYIFTPNIAASSSLYGDGFEAAIQETIFHEVVGHYGVRGLFRNEAALREHMFDLVDSFNTGPNSLAKRMEADLNLYGATNKTDPDLGRKQLLGEEMLAYVVGKKMSGQLDVTPKQKTVIQRILDWMRNWLNRHFGQYGGKFVSTAELQVEFWNDERVQDIVVMSTDFARRGPPYRYAEIEAGRSPQMRDGDIFQFNIQQIFRSATRKLSGGERKQLIQKYGGIENVPKELPMFPQEGSINAYKAAATAVSKNGNPYGIKAIEMEMLGLSDSAPWNLFRDLTYGELFELHARSQNRETSAVDRDWYQQYLPHDVRMELDAIFEALDKMAVVGPINSYSSENTKFLLDYSNKNRRPVTSEPSYMAMQNRIDEILEMKVNPKSTTINYDIFDAHINGSRAYKIYVEGAKKYPRLNRNQAAELLFGSGVGVIDSYDGDYWLDNAGGYDNQSTAVQELIDETIRLTEAGGVDIGYNERTGKFMDYPRQYGAAWQGYVPAGALIDEDYRVSLVKTKGGPYPEMPTLSQNHFDTNFMHIRHSVAEFADPPSWADYDAANEKYANRAWFLAEFQTDWSTHHRKGFESAGQRDSLHAKGQMLQEALSQAHDRGITTTARLVADMTTAAIEPMLAFIPEYESEKYSAPARVILDSSARTRFNKGYDELEAREKQEVWHLEYINRNEQLAKQLFDAEQLLTRYGDENAPNFRDSAGSLDARMFDKLDQYAANLYINHVRVSFKKARLVVENYNNPAAVPSAAVIKESIAREVRPLIDGIDDKARLRLPWAVDRIRPILTAAFEGISSMYDGKADAVEGVLSQFKEQTVTSFSIPKVNMENIFHGAKLGEFSSADRWDSSRQPNKPVVAAQRIFNEYWNTNFIKNEIDDPVAKAALIDGPLKFNFDVGTSDTDMIITVIGPESSQAIFDKYKEAAIDAYVRNMVPLNIESVRENNLNKSDGDVYKRAREEFLENNDLREWLEREHDGEEFDPIDPTQDDRRELDNHGVNHRVDFDRDERNTAERWVRENWSENVDWDEEGLNEDNEEYQRILEEEGTDAADEWLAEQRTSAEENFDGSDSFHDQVEFELDSMWESRVDNSNPPYLYVSQLPIEWDEDGDVLNTVEFKIQADDFGDSHYIWIDGDWKDYFGTADDAWSGADNVVKSYFENEQLTPPAGAFMGPAGAETIREEEDQKAAAKAEMEKQYPMPNLDILSSQAVDSIKMKSQDNLDLVASFKTMVEIEKKFGGKSDDDRTQYYKTFFPDSPMHSDKLWRVMGLKYILADAVRRGFGAIVWNDGLATATRGGGGVGTSDRVEAQRLDWSKEVIELGGKQEEVFVITSPHGELRGPIVITKQNMIQVLGVHAAGVMRAQADGNWTPPASSGKPVIKLPFTVQELKDKSNFVINEVTSSAAGRSTFSVHDTLANHFVGYYATREEAEAAIQAPSMMEDVNYEIARIEAIQDRLLDSTDAASRSREITEGTEALGKRITQGVIYPEDVGTKTLWVIPGNTVTGYNHTFPVPVLAGARLNYEQMNVDVWNKELKKYGVKIEFSYIKSTDPSRAYGQEGQPGKPAASADERFTEEYGAVEILSAYTGFTIISEKQGPVSNKVFPTYQAALKFLQGIKTDLKSSPQGLRVFTIVLNDKIKNEFSKPVSPFHYDKRLDDHLKSARSKFKNRTVSLADRARKFRARARGTFQHQFLDSYYGLKQALMDTESSMRSYYAARLSTGLEARVKAALYYGHPVWREDTTQSEGKGLMEILGGIEGDPQLWGMYMAGLRGKELMLEGYDNLTPEEQAEVNLSLKDVDGETIKEKIWNYVVSDAKNEPIKTENAYTLSSDEREAMGETAALFYDNSLYHWRQNKQVLTDDGKPDPRFKGRLKYEWQKRIRRSGPVFDPRANVRLLDDGDTTWELKEQNAIWDLMDDPNIKSNGNYVYRLNGTPKPGRYSKYEKAVYYGVETEAEAKAIIDTVINKALEKQAAIDDAFRSRRKGPVNRLVYMKGREKVFTKEELVSLVELGDSYPSFERVRKEFAEFNKKLLDFAEEAGVINPVTRKLWESEFYVPLYRIKDDRIGGPMAQNAGLVDLKKPIQRLQGREPSDPVARVVYFADRTQSMTGSKKDQKKAIDAGYVEVVTNTGKNAAKYPTRTIVTDKGSEFLIQQGVNVGDILDNIMMNMTALIDASVKNHAALMGVDDLKETGMIAKTPWKAKEKTAGDKGRIEAAVLKAIQNAGFNEDNLPTGMREELGKLMDIEPPSGPGIISVMRDGKKEYYKTDNMMLYESLTQVNRMTFGGMWNILTGPKRFFTGSITLSPVFMGTNVFRDSVSASISSRDEFIPFVGAMKGFISAISDDEVMRIMTSGGAAFEQGFITGGDEKATRRIIRKAMAKKAFLKTIVNDPTSIVKTGLAAAWGSYTKVGSSLENANRIAIYKAARANGKSLLQSLYESKDIMDFAMRGNNTAIQILCATVPFMGARIQGVYRTGRGARERPLATLIKGGLYMSAALAVWAQFREDDRYKDLEDWDKAVYHHFWLGDRHYRIPRAFEVGAIFTTIPEQWLEYLYSQEDDRGKVLLRQWAFMFGETFSMNPIPQTAKPIMEMMYNHNFFTGRSIVSPYQQRLPQDQFGPHTSETMRELSRFMPDFNVGKGNIKSPKHLENLYRGYTGTLGQYLLTMTDWMVRQSGDYPLPPTKTEAQDWLTGRFILGSSPPYRTKSQEEFYRMAEKLTSIQQSVSFYEKTGVDDERWDEILDTEAMYINIADDFEDIREDVRELNREEMEITFDINMEPDEKRRLIDDITKDRNSLYREAYEMRPGGSQNRTDEPAKTESLLKLIYEFGVNDSDLAKKRLNEESPSTMEVLETVRNNMNKRQLESLAKASATNE